MTSVVTSMLLCYSHCHQDVDKDVCYQSLNEAAHQAKQELQEICNSNDLTTEKRQILLKFATISQIIN